MKYLSYLLGLFLLFSPALARAEGGWEILSFDAVLEVKQDGLLEVTETILTDFHTSKHGIYRDIPMKYRNNLNQHISIGLDIESVTDETGSPLTYVLEREGVYRRIKIGDADTYIDGRHTYVIHYRVNRALRYFDDHDELYWNVTGNGWEVPIQHSSATVVLPFTPDDATKTMCYTGPTGSTRQDCLAGFVENKVVFRSNDMMTAAVSWPKGLVAQPTMWQRIHWFLRDNYGFLLPFIAAAVGYSIWSRRGRDPKGQGIVRQYAAPDKTTPSEMAYLVRQYFKPDDISAEIVSLARKGYIKITEMKTDGWIKDSYDYEMEQIKAADGLASHEKIILEQFFNRGVGDKQRISTLPKTFYTKVQKMKDAVWSSVQARAYFSQKPDTAWIIWCGAALAVGIPLYGVALLSQFRFDVVVGAILAEIVLIAFALFMPKRTEKGVDAYQYAQGFKQYIDAAETDRVKWEETQNLFFEILPYAMVFGIADKWAKAFEGKLNQQPSWYVGAPGHAFSPMHFNSRMNAFSAATVSHASPPSSNASGFSGGSSGGGGGGGGGGSW